MNPFVSVRRAAAVLALALSFAALPAGASGTLGAQALRARYASLQAQLADNPFGAQLVLQSHEAPGQLEGDVYAVLQHPMEVVSASLADPARWCEVMILHLNTKYCRRTGEGADTHLEVRVGTKHEQSLPSATLLKFDWQGGQQRADYFSADMHAPDGPYDTRDYRLRVEAVPLDGGRTFLHMGYAFGYGGASSMAMHVYLATLGRDKVGFTVARPAAAGGEPTYVDGMRGLVERNTMRYYLAIRSYLDALAAPPAQQPDKRFAAWFDATEKYPRQLHEVDRDAYLRMKRSEYQRQTTAR